jgi:DNA-binding MarR family transcriptional regulator
MAEYLKSFGLGVPQVQILNALGANGTLASKDIATYIAMNKALVSRSLSELTRLGYTATAMDADDARRSLWTLTKKGEDLVAAFRPVLLERRAKLMKVLSSDEQVLLTQFIERLYASSEQLGREEAPARKKRPAKKAAGLKGGSLQGSRTFAGRGRSL